MFIKYRLVYIDVRRETTKIIVSFNSFSGVLNQYYDQGIISWLDHSLVEPFLTFISKYIEIKYDLIIKVFSIENFNTALTEIPRILIMVCESIFKRLNSKSSIIYIFNNFFLNSPSDQKNITFRVLLEFIIYNDIYDIYFFNKYLHHLEMFFSSINYYSSDAKSQIDIIREFSSYISDSHNST